jgi:hypothetical protein
MPVKRRNAKCKVAYSEIIQKLIDGETIEPSAQARGELVGFGYFGRWEYPEIHERLRERAIDIVRGWREAGLI